MSRTPTVPPALRRGPFSIQEAKSAGIDQVQLRGRSWKRVWRGTYVWREAPEDPMRILEAARARMPEVAAFSGMTAAWLHGIDIAAGSPIELTVPDDAGVSARSGLIVRRALLPEDEVARVRGMRGTSIARTLADLSARLSVTEAVVFVDAALHAGRIGLDQLCEWAMLRNRRRGIRKLRRVIELAEPKAESPMESRLRMLLVLALLPRPVAQFSIRDESGDFIGRPDLYYERQRLAIEYDGASHRDTLAADNRRQNKLQRAGVRLLRFTAADVAGNPDAVVAQVRTMLAMPSRQSPANVPLAVVHFRRSPANARYPKAAD